MIFYYNTGRGTRLRPVHFQDPCKVQKCTVWAVQALEWVLRAPRPRGLGYLNEKYPIPGVNVVLYARFQHCRSNGVAAYKEHTHSHLYYIDLFRLRVHLPHYTHETNLNIMPITLNTVFK